MSVEGERVGATSIGDEHAAHASDGAQPAGRSAQPSPVEAAAPLVPDPMMMDALTAVAEVDPE